MLGGSPGGESEVEMELRQIKFFMAVAEERHFGRAAERMFIAQPALSQHVRRLERELEVQLFDRSARHVRLTPAGEAFLEVAQRMARQVDEATTAARRAEAGHTGTLAIGVHLPLAGPLLSNALRHWNRLRPAVHPRLTSGRTPHLIDLVRRHELDIAIVDGPVTDRALTTTPITDDPLVIVLPADHPLTQHQTISFTDLHHQPFITIARHTSMSLHDRLIELCGTANFNPHITLELDDPDLLPMAVTAGLGLAITPSTTITNHLTPGLTSRPLNHPRATIPLIAITAHDHTTTQTQDFLQLLTNHHHRNLLHPIPTDTDLTDPPQHHPTRILQHAV
jgi:DNA-binding transcriptional LysR family regulator